MTPTMISKARANADKGKFTQVEFRLGEIEHLPVADNSIDVIISNCVINLSPDKSQVFREMYRVLKIGGRLAISDVVATTELPESMSNDPYLHSACVGGAALIDDLIQILQQSGFDKVKSNRRTSHVNLSVTGCRVKMSKISCFLPPLRR